MGKRPLNIAHAELGVRQALHPPRGNPMIIIRDRISEFRFPLEKFLDRIMQAFDLPPAELVRLTRFGGNGSRLCELEAELESAIGAGQQFTVSLELLRSIFADPLENCDELRCLHDRVIFGLSDASFLFVEATDKRAEQSVAAAFRYTEECSDVRRSAGEDAQR
jgi:hypothetical protein